MFNFFRFSVLLLVGLHIFSAASDDCPEDKCASIKPAVDDNGNIVMTIWYDNDAPNDPYPWNGDMIRRACQAREFFKDKFSVDFIVGSGSRISDNNELMCKHDREADRRDGCAALLLLDATKFANVVCCNNTGGSDEDCAKYQGIDPSVFSNCINKRKSDTFLMDNGEGRRKAGIPGCHVPEFAFNNVIDRCLKITDFEELKKALCDIFKNGNISIDGC